MRANQFLGKADAIRTAQGQYLKICPITGGRPTRMTENGFAETCAAFLEKAFKKHGPSSFLSGRYRWCRECEGNQRPAELEIITLNGFTPEGAETMGNVKWIIGKCEVCGRKHLKVTKNHGMMACSTCTVTQSKVSKSPEIVVAELKRQHGNKYFPAADVPVVPVDELQTVKVLAEIREALGVGEVPMLAHLPEIVAKKMAKLQQFDAELSRLINENLDLINDSKTQADIIKDLMDNRGELLEMRNWPADHVPVARLLADSDLLAAVNTLADSMREAA